MSIEVIRGRETKPCPCIPHPIRRKHLIPTCRLIRVFHNILIDLFYPNATCGVPLKTFTTVSRCLGVQTHGLHLNDNFCQLLCNNKIQGTQIQLGSWSDWHITASNVARCASSECLSWCLLRSKDSPWMAPRDCPYWIPRDPKGPKWVITVYTFVLWVWLLSLNVINCYYTCPSNTTVLTWKHTGTIPIIMTWRTWFPSFS